MNRNTIFIAIIGVLFICLFSSSGYSQGDNTPDAMVNLGCLDDAVVTGSVPEGAGRGIPTDILWDPSTNDYKTPSMWHEYGLAYDSTAGGLTKENPLWWAVEWPTAKNVNYITVAGPFDNQPQPTTGWAVQVMVDGNWQDLAKADHGWDADTLRGIGGWVSDGILEWRGLEPVVTTGIRFTAYANPDSLADENTTFADSLWSMVFTGRKVSASSPHSVLIQYLDFSEEIAKNRMDPMVNLALLNEAVVSSVFEAGELDNIRGTPAALLYDPVKGDFYNTGTPWGEFGYPWQYDAGYLTEDEPFYWMCEWAVPKNLNYFTWGGVYGNQPQPNTPWAVQYWEDDAWVTVMDGIGGSFEDGLPGVDTDAQSVWQSETPIQTTKFRLAVWSDGIDPLFSYHIRGRGGSTLNWDETDSTFKCMLLQYKDLSAVPVAEDNSVQPVEFALDQNYPNPFNPKTNIQFSLQKRGQVRLAVYNVNGQEVAVLMDEMKSRGVHKVAFDASALTSGVYFYKLETNQGIITKKMLLLQ